MCVRKGGGGKGEKAEIPGMYRSARGRGEGEELSGASDCIPSLSLSRIKKSGIRCTMKKHAEDR